MVRPVAGALKKGQNSDVFFRMMMSPERVRNNETAFFILTFKCPVSPTATEEYEQYRIRRTNLSHIYANGILERYPHLKRVIGISCEPLNQERSTSEDMVYAEQTSWSDEERRAIREDCKRLSVFREDLEARPWHGEEFPEVVTIKMATEEDKGAALEIDMRER